MDCQDLCVAIGGMDVVDDLRQAFRPGEFWALLGANGVGKTTLLRHLAGLLDPVHGELRLDGLGLRQWPRRKLAQHLGMLQQHTSYVFDASVMEIALTGRHPHIRPLGRESEADRAKARHAISKVELEGLGTRSATSLSGGEARRLAFAALLVQDTDVLLLDEPTNHLDFRHQVKIMRLIGNRVYADGKLAIAALHDVNLAATYCSHVLMLLGKGVSLAGPAKELLTARNLERLYQCPVIAIETTEGTRFHPSFSNAAA